MRLAVEVFGAVDPGPPLNDVTAGTTTDGAVDLSPSSTKIVTTGTLLALTADDTLAIPTGTQGVARSVSSSTKVACAAARCRGAPS
jgi:hypothetical protein